MAVFLSPVGGVAAQFFDNSGAPLTGGKIYTYVAGTTTPQQTYTSASGNTPHSNPIILDSAGRVSNGGEIWLLDGAQYKFVLKTSTDTLIATYDNITGINSNFINYANSQEIQTATAGQTIFTLTTMQYLPGTNSLSVFVDGVNQYGPGAQYAYVETDATTVTFTTGLHVGAEVKFTSSQINSSSYGDASQIAFTGFNGQTGNVQNLADDDGSDWIGFLQDGTGAVAISAQDKMRQIVSVKDFGAVGDGVTDDTAAIQAAIDYCTNLSNRKQTLYFPAAQAACVYKITFPLVIKGRLNIVGDGQFSTIIQAVGLTNSDFVIDFDCDAADQIYYCEVNNIKIASDNQQPIGIRMKNVSYMLMKQVSLSNLNAGIFNTGTVCFSNAFEEVTCYGISSYGVYWNDFSGGGQWAFRSCTFTGSDGVVASSTSSLDTLGFYNCNFEQCTTTDMYIGGNVVGLTISGCRSEGLDGGTSFLIQPSVGNSVAGLTITGCFWTGDFGNANPINIDGAVNGYSITGNHVGYMGFQQFVKLGSNTSAGIIAGNNCVNSPKVISEANSSVTLLNNKNASGELPDYFGFTLTDASGAGLTFTAAEGSYTKIGNTVFWKAWLIFPATANTNATDIAGLPIPVKGIGTWSRAGAQVDLTDYAGSISVMQGYSTSTRLSFWDSDLTQLTNNQLSGKTLYLSGSYTA